MDTEHNQSDSIMPFLTRGEISASPRASPRMQLERATSTGNMDLGVCSTSPRASPRMQLEGGATSTGNMDSGVCSTSPRESKQMELEEANTTVTGLGMGECSISPRVLRHMLLDESDIGRTLELEERLLSPHVSQYVQFEEGVVAGRLDLGQCSGSWSSPRDFFSDSPRGTSTSGSLEGHKSPLLTSPAYENTDLWEELKAKWEMEQWKRGLRLQMVLENIEKCGRTQEMIMPRQTAACPSSQNLNRQACDVPKPINTCTVDTNSYSSSPHDDNSSNWFNPLDKLVKNTTTCSTNTCSTSTDTISDDNSKWYSPLDRHWM